MESLCDDEYHTGSFGHYCEADGARNHYMADMLLEQISKDTKALMNKVEHASIQTQTDPDPPLKPSEQATSSSLPLESADWVEGRIQELSGILMQLASASSNATEFEGHIAAAVSGSHLELSGGKGEDNDEVLPKGQAVIVDGLKNNAEFNGVSGEVLQYDAGMERYIVLVQGEHLALRRSNLTIPLDTHLTRLLTREHAVDQSTLGASNAKLRESQLAKKWQLQCSSLTEDIEAVEQKWAGNYARLEGDLKSVEAEAKRDVPALAKETAASDVKLNTWQKQA